MGVHTVREMSAWPLLGLAAWEIVHGVQGTYEDVREHTANHQMFRATRLSLRIVLSLLAE